MSKIKRKKIGLALGGGGAKGLAHIGVLKVLERNDIPIDYIAGTSIGAMVGGYYAASKSVSYVEKMALDSNMSRFASLMFELTREGGLVRGNKILAYLEKSLDGIDFSELEIPFAAVATELNCGETVYFEKKGDVAAAIRASISYPPVFSPFKIKNRLFVDGGLSCQVPVKKVFDMGADVVIAVALENDYIFKKREFDKEAAFGNTFGNTYRVLNSSIKVLVKRLGEYDTKCANVVISPKVGSLRTWMDFGKSDRIIKIGEDAAKKSIKDIKKLL